ncbi:hypothetical protein [Actinobacillus genomosp. 1]|uniref:COG4648 family protein n=1 Tax=Actinobacillus genomosp. 1 TaxID=254839 RepID=UPI002441DF7A|nr:hypothetical protein [Actinobacillus genomosp. 1]WGE91021.1 hypothetical protein NYR63_09410 [Actinobacillus genomosp. 1]
MDWLTYMPFSLAFLWFFQGMQAVGFQRFFAFFMSIMLGVVGISRGLDWMYWYPVAINIFMLMIFGSSLWAKQTVIEKFARLQDPNLPAEAIAYTRKVTQVWCAVFILNITVTVLLICLKRVDAWAIYTGVIAYIIMAIVMVGEWLIRPKHNRTF